MKKFLMNTVQFIGGILFVSFSVSLFILIWHDNTILWLRICLTQFVAIIILYLIEKGYDNEEKGKEINF